MSDSNSLLFQLILQKRYQHYEPTVGTRAILKKTNDSLTVLECMGSMPSYYDKWICSTEEPSIIFKIDTLNYPVDTPCDINLNDPSYELIKSKL